MSFNAIPKKIVRSGANPERKIPYIIHQTFKSNLVPEAMYNAAHSYINTNPNYDYVFYDDDDILNVLATFDCSGFAFTSADLQKAYGRMATGAGRADVFRYVIMYMMGGCYFDIDTVCKTPLDNLILADDEVVSGVGERGDLHQWGLIYCKEHPFIKKTLETCVYNIINEKYIRGYQNYLEGLTGPPVLDHAIKQVLNLPAAHRFVAGIYEIGGFRFHILGGDLFDNNIEFKYPNYMNDLKSMGVPYWAGRKFLK